MRRVHRSVAALLAVAFAWGCHAATPAAPSWEVATSSAAGKIIVAQLPETTVTAAVHRTVKDLAGYFGAAPTLRSAFEDSHDRSSGGATFTVRAWGVPAKGTITCRVGAGGTRVAVAFVRADAPRAEWEQLIRSQPAPSAGSAGAPASGEKVGVANASLRTYRFPDGTGTVGLAEGWSTRAQSAMGGVLLTGPSGESIMLGQSLSVVLPGSSLAQFGGLVAPFGSPVDTIRILVPQLSRQSVRNGGPSVAVDHVALKENRPATLPGGRAAVLTWGVTEAARGGPPRHYLAMALVELVPVSASGYMVSLYSARAPDAIFAQRLPVMLQMMGLFKTDDARVTAKSQENVAAQKRWFAGQQAAHRAQVQAFDAQQEAHRAQVSAFDEHNRGWERGQLDQARRNDDFDEVIRGVRTVEDTSTGEKRSVSLGDVDRYVDDLNTADPGRYKQIPLRDETDPLPGK